MLANHIAEIIVAADRIIHPGHYRLISFWKNLGVPHRPNKEEIAIYKKFLGELSPEDHILILGATPELRDLILQLNARSLVADYSPRMIVAMEKLMTKNPRFRETLLTENWLGVNFPDNFFTAILGDLSLRHIEPKNQHLFLEKMHRWTKPNGKIILRLHFINPRHAGRSHAVILDEMKHQLFFEKPLHTMSLLLSKLYDASTRDDIINYQSIKAGIHDYLLKTDIPFSYRVFLWEFLVKKIKLFSKPLTSRTKESYEKLFSAFYTVENMAYAGNYLESEFYPIYSLLPRK